MRILNEIGRKYYLKGMPDSAIIYFEKRLKMNGMSKKERWGTLSYLGVCHLMKGTYVLALNYYLQALKLAETMGDSLRIGGAYRGVADTYANMNKTDTALICYDRSIRYLESVPDGRKEYSIAQNNKANTLRKAGRYGEALEIHKRNMPRLKETRGLAASAHEEIGICYTYLGEYPEAERNLLEALQLAEEVPDDVRLRIHINYSLSRLYYLWKGRRPEAKRLGREAFRASKNGNYDNVLLPVSELLYKMYKEEGKTDSALYFHEVFMEVKDKNYVLEQDKAELAVRMEYENSIVREQNLRQSERIKLQERLQYMMMTFLVVLSGLLILLFGSRKKITRQRKMIQQQNEELAGFNRRLEQRVIEKTGKLDEANKNLVRLNNELVESIVKGQTIERKRVAAELHDNLGSQLVAVKWLYSNLEHEAAEPEFTRKYEQIRDLLDETYKTVRDISHNMLPEEFEKSGLTGAVPRLFANVNGSGKIKFSFDFSSYTGLERKKEFEIYHILMELTTNTLKHSRGEEVLLAVESTGPSKALIRYHDDTPGDPYAENRWGKGMKNIEERVLLIRGKISLKKTIINGKEYNSFIIKV